MHWRKLTTENIKIQLCSLNGRKFIFKTNLFKTLHFLKMSIKVIEFHKIVN